MSTQIFVNLPVADLRRSIAFFTRLGFSFNEQFTDDTATCMVIGDNIFVMLLIRTRFQSFTPKPVCDAMRHSEVRGCRARGGRAAGGAGGRAAGAAGGAADN